MKLKKVSKKILKYMVNEYHSSSEKIFFFDDLVFDFKDIEPNIIDDSLWLLNRKQYISVSPADDVAYKSELTTTGIEYCESDTLFKKILFLMKELKTLVP